MRTRILKRDFEKRELIGRLSNERCSLMFFCEDAPGEDVLHEPAGESITVIHPPYDYETLEKWLYPGNWQAIFPANKDYRPLDTFNVSDSDIECRMNEAKLSLVIDSFHDDIEWNVIEQT